jgi:SM-20-related protein
MTQPLSGAVSAEAIGERILEEGLAVVEGVLPPAILDQLREEALADFEAGRLTAARIGRGEELRHTEEIRSDRIRWLSPEQATPAQAAYWALIDGLRVGLGEFFRIHLAWMEAHFAVYPEGGHYARHRDQHRGSGSRLVTAILYLNPAWQPGDGGELRVHPEEGPPADHAPLHGRLVVFRSDELEHEVLPSRTLRVAISGWMRRDAPPA